VEAGEVFEAQRPRLLSIATRVLDDSDEAQDVVQQAWLRWHGTGSAIENLPAWLTTVTTRLCLDRLRARLPVLDSDVEAGVTPDPAEDVVLADTVGAALQVVLDRLSPRERVAFVLHDTFAVDFPTIAAVLDTTPVAARKLASRARAKVGPPRPQGHGADWEVVDAFMAAAREGDFARLLRLLAPDVQVRADEAAVLVGTPARLDGRHDVATFFNGSASAALPVFLGEHPAAAWFHRGQAKVLFDLTVVDGLIERITFRADPQVLARLRRRSGGRPHR
jgi:RNA polymerase sigma factor (sigma-70 family)